jgi:hypothetical protein
MKLQFSLATLLVCMTVLAVVCAACALVPVYFCIDSTRGFGKQYTTSISFPPTLLTFAQRLAWSVPLALAATFGVLWAIRRLKSRRHTEPPVG